MNAIIEAGSEVAGQTTPWEELEDRFAPGLISHLRAIAADLHIPPMGREYIRNAAEKPSRKVRSTPKSSSGAYPSRKVGATIEFESRTLELSAITKLEHDANVVAYFNQPPSLAVTYRRDGRQRSYHQTPDFLVVRRDAVVLVECKPLSKIAERNARDPDFYVQTGKQWTCPALQAAAGKLGMRHEVWSEDAFSQTRMRNLRMVGDYMLHSTSVAGYDSALKAMRQLLDTKARATVAELLDELRAEVCVDHLYLAIGCGDIAFDLDAAPLAEPQRCFAYRNRQTMQSFGLTSVSRAVASQRIVGAALTVSPGTQLNWDGAVWRCMNLGATVATLSHGDRVETIPRAIFDQLVHRGSITHEATDVVASVDQQVHELIAKASPNDLKTANLRHTRILPYLMPGSRPAHSRTLRRYLAGYRQAQAIYGNGFVGLLPGFSKSGNRKGRLVQAVLDIVVSQVRANYLNATNKHKKSVYTLVVDECKSKALPPPSYAWFCRFTDNMPAYDVKNAREGRKGAYRLEPRVSSPLSAEPERPFQNAHVDHTLIDVEMIFGETSEPLGRCWLTLMVDHYSRRVLAHYVTFDAPSYRSVLMVMRNCVQRHGRLPESITVDGGKEFCSVYFETVCALYKVTVIRRPVSKGRFGSQVERMFGTSNTNLFHFMSGNTQLRKNVRQMTDEVDPCRGAVWTLPELDRVVSRYYYEVYDNLEHRELLVTPRFAFERGMERHGSRPDRLVAYNELFIITTSPSPAKGTAKVQPDGVKIHYVYYNAPELQSHLGRSVAVRYDPFDMSVAWAYIDRQWVRLRTRHQRLLRDFTEHDLALATAEWRKRRSDVEKTRLSEPVLVKFLQEILETETLLLERKRSAEERRLRESVDGWQDGDGDPPDEPGEPTADAGTDVNGDVDVRAAAHVESEPCGDFATVEDDIGILETM